MACLPAITNFETILFCRDLNVLYDADLTAFAEQSRIQNEFVSTV